MKKRKQFISLLLISIMLILYGNTCYAHPDAREHDAELESILFEDGYSKYQSDDIKYAIKALEYASNLTIDQSCGNGENKYNELKKMKMGGLPLKFSTIDYVFVPGTQTQINANTHRMYTHQGWDRDYSAKGKDIEKFWKARRNVLLGTVNSIFNFDKITMFGYGDKCNSLAGIIYYVHILGDYAEANTYKKIVLLTDLAGRNNANDDDKDYDMITSLKEYIEILFEEQSSTTEYKNLMEGLNDIEKKASKLVQSVGGVNTDEEFEEYHQYAADMLELLKENVPTLLKNEEFFNKVFYPERSE